MRDIGTIAGMWILGFAGTVGLYLWSVWEYLG